MSTKLYMEAAKLAASFHTCPRAACGAALVTKDGTIYLGYNGPTVGEPKECVVLNGHCVNTIHAEVRVLLLAAKAGGNTKGATLYSHERPCHGCMAAMAEAGVVKCFYANDYHSTKHKDEYWSNELADLLRLEQYEPEE